MPDDINKRMNYFDRQFLRAADFKVEQEYHLHRHRLHNKLLHTPGVAAEKDLKVSGDPGTKTLTVDPGIAVDVEGREIVLLEEHRYSLDNPLTEPGNYELTVRFAERLSDPSTDPGVDGATRMKEEPIFELLAPNMVKPSMLRLAAVEVEPAGTLKSKPTSLRAFAGTVVGASTTFETVTANTFTLQEVGIDIAKRPDVSCDPSGDILLRTTRPANSSPEESLRITSTGFLKSKMWKVTSLFENIRAPGTIEPETPIFQQPKEFETGGGTLLIFASGSGAAKQAPTQTVVIGMQLLLGNTPIGEVKCSVKNQDPQPFVTTFLVVPNIAPGKPKLNLKTLPGTTVTGNDFFNVTILELPF